VGVGVSVSVLVGVLNSWWVGVLARVVRETAQ
jgi:hypothetical protein